MKESLETFKSLKWSCTGKRKKVITQFFKKLESRGHAFLHTPQDVKCGEKYPAIVKCGKPQGVFIYLSPTVEARIKLSELPESPLAANQVEKLYPTGRFIPQVWIDKIENASKWLIEASIKNAKHGLLTFDEIEVGSILASEVKRRIDSGLILTIENSNLTAFCYVSEIADEEVAKGGDDTERRKTLLEMYPVRSRVAVRVLTLDASLHRIFVTMKPSAFPESFVTLQEKKLSLEEKTINLTPAEETKDNISSSQDHDDMVDSTHVQDDCFNYDDVEEEEDEQQQQQQLQDKEDTIVSVEDTASYQINDGNEDNIAYADCVAYTLESVKRCIAQEGGGKAKRVKSVSTHEDAPDDTSDVDDNKKKPCKEEPVKTFQVCDESKDDDKPNKKSKQRRKTKLAAQIDEELHLRETEIPSRDTDAVSPETVFDFERLVHTESNASCVWIRYIAYYLKMRDVEKARQTADRALEKIDGCNEIERLNVWIAYLNLEATFGTPESLDGVLKRALLYNDPKKIYLQMTYLYQRQAKFKECFKFCNLCVDKYPGSKKMWIRFLTCLFEIGSIDESSITSTVRSVLMRALKCLNRAKQPQVVCAVGRLEVKYGSAERGQIYFENLLSEYPKRTDLWGQYIDAMISAVKSEKLSVKDVRTLFEKAVNMEHMFKPRQMKYFFSRWLSFETLYGDSPSQDSVIAKAKRYVDNICSSKSGGATETDPSDP